MRIGGIAVYNLNIERAVLATILYQPEKADDILESLKDEAFYHPAHRAIYQTIEHLAAKSIPIDEDFIRKHYKGGEWDSDVFFEILSTTPLPNPLVYIDELNSLSKTRKTASLFREGLARLDGGEDTDTVISEVEDALSANAMISEFKPTTLTALLQKQFPIPPVFATGLQWIDDSFGGGFQCGTLIAFGGSKDAGKTTLTEQIFFNITGANPAAYFGLEFNPRNFQQKVFKQRGRQYKNDNFFYISRTDTNCEITDICSKIKLLNKKHTVRFFCIDSQMRLWKNAKNLSKEERTTSIFDELSSLAVRLDICIFMIVQYSKEDAKAKDFEIMYSKLAGHIVDAMIDIERLPNGKRKVSIVKNKIAGKYDTNEVGFDTEKLEFETFIGGRYEEHIYQADDGFAHLKI